MYRQPNLQERVTTHAVSHSALSKVEDRLDGIQNMLNTLWDEVSSSSNSGRRASVRRTSSSQSPSDLSPSCNILENSSPSFRNVVPGRTHGVRMPNLITFVSPASLGPFSYDSAQTFFKSEMQQGEQLFGCIDALLWTESPITLSKQKWWRLQRAFVNGFLHWMPLFDDETCIAHLQKSSEVSFQDSSASTCLSLLMFAIGAVVEDQTLYQPEPNALPGFEYLSAAYKILQTMKTPTFDIEQLQCRVLFAAYLSFVMRPVTAWKEISQVARDLLLVLKTNWGAGEPHLIDMLSRTYWVVYVIENELEICLELSPSGLRAFQDQVPLPTSTFDDEGLYYFLALISLRKLLVEVHETVGYKSGHAIYLPIIAHELYSQFLSWHSALPPSLKFPLDASPLFDLRKTHLRGQFFAHTIVVFWPFVFRYIDDVSSPKQQQAANHFTPSNVDAQAVHDRSTECLKTCLLYLAASETILMQNTVVTHINLRAYYATMMVLLLACGHVMNEEEQIEAQKALDRGVEVMELWSGMKWMEEPLERVRRFATTMSWGEK